MLLYIVKQFITHYFVWQKTDLANLLTSSLCFAVHVARVTSHYPTGHFTPKGGVKISFGNGGSLGWVLLSPTRSKNADFRSAIVERRAWYSGNLAVKRSF